MNIVKEVIIIGICIVIPFVITACGRISGSELSTVISTSDNSIESVMHNPPPDEPVLTKIVITTEQNTLEGILFDNETAKKFAEMLPLTVELWNPAPGFAKAFDLPEWIPDVEQHTRQYEKGGLAYWYDGPSIAIFYGDYLEETIVPVVTVGRITSDVDFLEGYEGSITIEKKEVGLYK